MNLVAVMPVVWGYGPFRWILILMGLAAAIAVLYVILKQFNWTPPQYMVQVAGILLALFVGVLALCFIAALIGSV